MSTPKKRFILFEVIVVSVKKMYNSLQYKNSQFIFYAKNFLKYVTPSFLPRGKLKKILASLQIMKIQVI